MKVSTSTVANAVTATGLTRPVGASRLGDWMELVKVRLSALVLVTTLSGFYLGSAGSVNLPLLVHALCGTALLAFGASALNQYQERHMDGRMKRTVHRPLPAERMSPATALGFGVASAIAGVTYLALAVNVLTAVIGAATLLTYNLIYTPMKRVTWLNTIVGAVPGALPPVMGWTAARDSLSPEAWILFAILFFWQIPHFMAIAWLYREDYERGGFVMLPHVDADGRRTGRQAIWHSVALMGASIAPVAAGLAGHFYFASALVLGALMIWASIRFRRELSMTTARRLFLASITYLPLLLAILALNKLGE